MRRKVASRISVSLLLVLGMLLQPAQSFAAPGGTAAPLDRVYQATCPTPRPAVRLQTQALGDGRIQSTITAGFGALALIRFGTMQNAHVEVPGSAQTYGSNAEIKPPDGATSWTFLLVGEPATQAGQAPPASTIPLTIFDGCGPSHPWSTFIGGGATALQSTASIADTQVIEGNTGTTLVTFTVTLSVPSSRAVSFAYATADGSARSGQDYVPASGTLTFNPGETSKTITVQVKGNFTAEPDKTFTVTLSNPVNAGIGKGVATARILNDDTGPTASGDSYTATQGQTPTVGPGAGPPPGLLYNDQAGSQNPQIASFGGLNVGGDVTTNAAGSTVNLGNGGSLTVNADGSFTFTSPSTFTGSFSFRYRAASASGASDATVTIGVRKLPNAVDDPGYAATGSTPLQVPAASGVLANDDLGVPPSVVASFGGGNSGGSVTSTQAGSARDLGNGGSLTVNADGSFSFTAPSTATGPFTFQYRLQNDAGFDDATVTIDVRRGPTITTTSGSTPFLEGGSAVPVDPGATIVSPGNANLTLLTATIAGLSDAGQETLAANTGGTAISASYAAPTLTLSGSDTVAHYQQVLQSIAYLNTAPAPTTGARTVSFQGTASGQPGNTATKAVSVGGVNDPPSGQDKTITLNEDTTYIFAAADFGFSDPNDVPPNTLQGVKITTLPADGTLADNGSPFVAGTIVSAADIGSGKLTFTPAANANGSPYTTFTFQVQDNGGTASGGIDLDQSPNTITLNVSAVNDRPTFVISPASHTSLEDAGPQTVPGFATAIDDGDPELVQTVAFTLTPTGTTGGLAFTTAPAISDTGTLTYRAAPNSNGSATFDVVLTDNGSNVPPNQNSSTTVSITINVTSVPDNPTAVDDTTTVLEDAAATTIDVLANETNPDSVAMTVTGVTAAGHGLTAVAPSNTAVTYAPNANYCNTEIGGTTDSFTYTIAPGGSTATVTVTVTCVNDAPTFTLNGSPPASSQDAGLQTVANVATAIDDGDPEVSQTLTFNLSQTASTGGLTFSSGPAIDASTGTLTYTASPGGSGTATFSVTLSDNGSNVAPNVNTSAPQSLTITVNDLNDAPTFTLGANPTVNEDAGATTVTGFVTNISPGPANESAQTVGVTITNDTNAALFAAGPTLVQSGTTGDLSFTPAANANGTATITIQASDSGPNGGGNVNFSTQTFDIIVTAVNDAPTFSLAGNPPASNESAGAQTVATFATAIDDGDPEISQILTFNLSLSGSTGGLTFSSGPAIDPATGTLTYTASTSSSGTATFSVTLSDNGSNVAPNVNTSAPQSFTITVIPRNDPPSFTLGGDQTVLEDSGAHTVPGFVSNISPGPGESSQTVTLSITNVTNSAFFTVQPSVTQTGDLSFTLAADAFGTSVVTVQAQDDGPTGGSNQNTSTQTFNIIISPVNDVPSFTKGADQTVLEDSGTTSVANWATGIGKGPANESGQTVNFIVSNDNNPLFSTQPAVSAAGTLTYTPALDQNGTATVSVQIHDDGGTANGGVDTSAIQTFTITVNHVNDPPVAQAKTATALANVPLAITGLLTGASDAKDQVGAQDAGYTPSFTLNGVTAVSCTPACTASDVGISNVSNANSGSFTFDPPAGFTGTVTLNYTIQDSGSPAPPATSAAATITVTVNGTDGTSASTAPVMWFIDNNVGACSATCDGRLSHPFTSTASFQAVNNGSQTDHPGQNDTIFIYESASPYSSTAITLLSGQKLVGQDATASLGTISFTGTGSLPAGSTLPTMNPAGNAVTLTSGSTTIALGSNNTLRGFTLGDASSSTLSGSGFGTLTLASTPNEDVKINNTTDQALSLTTGSVSGALVSTSSTNSAGNGINLNGVNGSIDFGDTTVSSSAGTAVNIVNGSANVTFGTLNLSPSSGAAGLAASGSTGTLTATAGTITASNAAAISIDGPSTKTALAISLTKVSSSGAASGISLIDTGGTFTITGTGSAACTSVATCTGGAIQNTTGDGIVLTRASSVSLTRMFVAGSDGHAINATDLGGTNTLSTSAISNWDTTTKTKNGFNIVNNNTTLTLLTVTATSFTGSGNANAGLVMEAQGSSNMTLSVEGGSTFTGMFGDGVDVLSITGSTGTVNATVKSSSFTNAVAQSSPGVGGGNGGIGLFPFGGAHFTVNVDTNTFDNIMNAVSNLGAISITNGLTATATITIQHNTIDHLLGSRGITATTDGNSQTTLKIDDNSIDRLSSTSKHGISVDVGQAAGESPIANVRVTNNRLGQAAQFWTTGDGTGNPILLTTQFSGVMTALVDGNTVDANTTSVIEVSRVRAIQSSTLNATVTNNNLQDTSGTHVEFDASTGTGGVVGGTICLNVASNIVPASGVGVISLHENASPGAINVTQASAAAIAAANNGATVTVAGSPAFGQPACPTPP